MRFMHGMFGIAAAAMLPMVPLTAQSAPAAEAANAYPAARQAIADVMAEHSIPALSVAVYRGDALVWEEGFGTAALMIDKHLDLLTVEPTQRMRSGSRHPVGPGQFQSGADL